LKILVNTLSGIGDALMFTPALSILKKELPDAQIDAFVMFKGVKDLYESLDEIDDVYFHDMIDSSKVSNLRYIYRLRKNRYDISINVYPSNRKEYNIVNMLIAAEKRAGVKYNRKDRLNLGFLNNCRIVENEELHCVEENIKQIENLLNINVDEIPALNFPMHKEELQFAEEYKTRMSIFDIDLVIGIHAGCSVLKNHINRRWSLENFTELISKLIDEKNAKVLLFGGPDENELKDNIVSQVGSEKLINVETKNLRETAAVIKHSDLFVTNDSGLMHIAAALGCKIVPIIGPTNENYIHPWKTEYKTASLNLDCAPCFHYSPKPLTCSRKDIKFKCLKELSVDRVFKVVEQMI